MPTKNPRVHITLDPTVIEILDLIAQQEHKSLSLVTKELVLQALETKEDLMFSTVAEARDSEDAEFVSHEDAWK